MLQFTAQEVASFQKKAQAGDPIIPWLVEKTKLIRENPLQIPTEGVANWSLYYYCADCSVPLTYDFFKPKEHLCPRCGKAHEGEPFDGAWWRFVHSENDKACYYLGLLYICTGDLAYAQRAKEILLQYATYYPGYQVHGDIPYNGPGKAHAQTLSESIFLRQLACGYDLICDTLTAQERAFIEQDLLICGAEFLVQNRHHQIHNHEVITNSAIAVIGLITQNKNLIDFSLYQEYGMVYQLEKGTLADGIWFECSLGYHYFALQSFFAYEKFAQHTEHSHIYHPNYAKMFDASLKFLLPDGTNPLINDTLITHTPTDGHHLFEFAYRAFQTPALLDALHKSYRDNPRGDIESFFYGVDTLPAQQEQVTPEDYHSAVGSGVSLVRGSNDQYLLFRHAPYGGEHDHYDRLALSYYYQKQPIAIDFGTTGYGAYYHYHYFKNTGTHNTVVIDEENHAPSTCKVLAFGKDDAHTYIDAAVTWEDDYEMPDSFVICQWSDEAYRGVSMRRQVYKADQFLVDVFTVDHVADKTIDWCLHVNGVRHNSVDSTTPIAQFSDKTPFKELRNVVSVQPTQSLITTQYVTDTLQTTIYTAIEQDTTLLYADGPSNPTAERIEYMLQRKKGNHAQFVNVIATSPKDCPVISDVVVTTQVDCVIIQLNENGFAKTVRIAK